MIEKLDVTGAKAIEYFREQLQLGARFLSGNLLSLPVEKGKIYSFVPRGTEEEIVNNFAGGVLYEVDKTAPDFNPQLVPVQNEARTVLINLLSEYLSGDNCCIFEHPYSSPDDPWLKNSEMEYIQVQNDVLFFFDEENNDREEIQKAWSSSEGHYFLCVLGKLAKEKRALFVSGKETSEDLLKAFLQKPQTVIIRAYDGEGYLMWEGENVSTLNIN